VSTGHTPVPWASEDGAITADGEKVGVARLDPVPRFWAGCKPVLNFETIQANARLIVRAVNAHAALVEAAEAYVSCDPEIDYWEDIVESHSNCGCDWCARAARVLAARKALRTALALAKGEAP
jgi:hypothetical protein